MGVAIVVNIFGNADLSYVVESLRNAGLVNEQIHVVLSWSNPPPNALAAVDLLRKAVNDAFDITYLPLPKMGSGKQRDLTLGFVLRRFPNVRYVVYAEDDVVINESGWLNKLIELFNKMPNRVAALSLEPGSRLCIDFVATNIVTDRMLYIGLSGGSGVTLIRAEALKELISLGAGMYSSFMYFHWEDMGYVTVSLCLSSGLWAM
jgi:hypothetical protein